MPAGGFVRRVALIAGSALIAGAAVWYGWSWIVGRFVESTDDAYVGGEVSMIASKVAGFVETVAIADNQVVKAGDLLVKLDDRDYRAQLARTDASVAAQNATLARVDLPRQSIEAFGEEGTAEFISLVGLYCMVSVTLASTSPCQRTMRGSNSS